MRLDDIARASLGTFPTPLHFAERLTKELGGPDIWIKRDDLSGLALGGNKVRKLEYLLADALAQGADTVLTTGAAQSNHARQTAAACARLGLRCVLVLRGDPDTPPQGNLLLDHLLGAEVHVLNIARDQRAAAMHRIAEDLKAQGCRPYEIPLGGSNGLGALGYAAAVGELAAQLTAAGIQPTAVITCSSSGGTHAGLVLGRMVYKQQWPVWGISNDGAEATLKGLVAGVAAQGAALLGIAQPARDDIIVFDQYVGAGYGIMTEGCRQAMHLLARTEGILLDPVYTGKAMAGLIDLVRRGVLHRGQSVVFIHTGGAPALFAYQQEVL